MNDISIVEYEETDLKNSMLIVAFPTVGLISSIAGHYIIDSLKLKQVGTILSDKFMPATVIHKSIPAPPVRIYAGTDICGPRKSCTKLAIIISEFMPSFEIIKPLSDAILNWAEKKGCDLILTLEGTHAQGNLSSKKSQIFGIATSENMVKELDSLKVKQTQEGMITGVTGVLLYQGFLSKKDVLCLLAETHVKYPDSRAAAAIVEKLDKLLPKIKIDAEPLYKEAKQIEDTIIKAMEQSKPTAPTVPQIPQTMYG